MMNEQTIIIEMIQLLEANKRTRLAIEDSIKKMENNDLSIQVQLKKLDSLMKQPLKSNITTKQKN